MCDRQRWLNGPLRFDNEPARHKLLDLLYLPYISPTSPLHLPYISPISRQARHKLLDLLGDLALLGALPCAHVVAWKARAL